MDEFTTPDGLLSDEWLDEPIDELAISPEPIYIKRHQPHLQKRKGLSIVATQRLMRGITQAELAHRVGTTRRTIHSIETDQHVPSVYVAIAIAQALELKVENIFHLQNLLPKPRPKH